MRYISTYDVKGIKKGYTAVMPETIQAHKHTKDKKYFFY